LGLTPVGVVWPICVWQAQNLLGLWIGSEIQRFALSQDLSKQPKHCHWDGSVKTYASSELVFICAIDCTIYAKKRYKKKIIVINLRANNDNPK
jgi:hypothetical protein